MISIVAGPSLISKQAGDQKKELAESHMIRLEFWKGILDKTKAISPNLANRTPSKENWFSFGSGKSGINFNYVVRMDDAQIELYIDRNDIALNKQCFDTLFAKKELIEKEFGKSLEWQRLEERTRLSNPLYVSRFWFTRPRKMV